MICILFSASSPSLVWCFRFSHEACWFVMVAANQRQWKGGGALIMSSQHTKRELKIHLKRRYWWPCCAVELVLPLHVSAHTFSSYSEAPAFSINQLISPEWCVDVFRLCSSNICLTFTSVLLQPSDRKHSTSIFLIRSGCLSNIAPPTFNLSRDLITQNASECGFPGLFSN